MKDAGFTWKSCFFWIVVLGISICLQRLITGVDILCFAFIWVLHDGRWSRFFWLVPLLFLLQEGGGSMAFGTSILWYASMMALFLLGRCIFAVESVLFMLLFSLAMGFVNFVLLNGMTGLQNICASSSTIFYDSIWQVACICLSWICVVILRQRFARHAHTV